MNANSKLPAPKIEQWLRDATAQLKAADIPTARLDAELILAHVLKKDRTWLIAHSDEPLTDESVLDQAASLLSQRLNRIPLAYLTGHREFYGRNFTVTPDVLIPRPETEEIIEQLKLLGPKPGQRLIDIGAGSGAIAITAALEFPDLNVEAVDVSPSALEIAKQNAGSLHAKVDFYQSDLLANTKHSYNFILANLPYVDRVWERSAETEYEPALALFADDSGLSLIKTCIEQSVHKLTPNGYLLLEADPRQFDEIIAFALQHDFEPVRVNGYTLTLGR